MNICFRKGRDLLLVLALAACGGSAFAQNAPDAPDAPQVPATPPDHIAVPATRPATPEALARRKWSGVVEPGEKIPPMTLHDKLVFPLHEEIRWTTLVPILISGGYGVLSNSDPKYGTNGDDFAKRVGASALHQAISREISDSMLPILLHEDPRYYRQAYGSYESRTEHAIRRVFVSQRDSGTRTFNYSDTLGRGMAAALTQTFYPVRSQSPKVVFKTWGYSELALAGGNMFEEFWPDVKRKLFHKSE